MKTTIKHSILYLAVLGFSLVFTSCSKDDDDDEETSYRSALIGTWQQIQYSYVDKENGEIVDSGEKDLENGSTITFKADGTFYEDDGTDMDENESCTWKYEGGKLYLYWFADGEETDDMDYSILELTPTTLIFEWNFSDTEDGIKYEEYEKHVFKKIPTTGNK